MMLQEELQRIIDNLTLKSGDCLVDMKIDEKKESMQVFIQQITKNALGTMNIIGERELVIYENILRDAMDTVRYIQEAVMEENIVIGEKIATQQIRINNRYVLYNFYDAAYRYDNLCDGLIRKYHEKLCQIYKEDDAKSKRLNRGNIHEMNLGEEEMTIVTQLNGLIRYYELDGVRKEIINIVKYIMIKAEQLEKH